MGFSCYLCVRGQKREMLHVLRLVDVFCILCLLVLVNASVSHASQDKIILKAGAPVEGEIIAFNPQANTVTLRTDKGEIPYPMANIARLEMQERPQVAEGLALAAEDKLAEAVAKLKPVVDQFLGLDVPWVPQAAAALAEALARSGKTFDSEQLADRIAKAYPNSVYRLQGEIAKASSLLARQQADQALQVLMEVEKNILPSPAPDLSTRQILSSLYFTKGQIFKAKGDKARAYEAFLTVASLYHLPASRAAQAMQEAEELRRQDGKLAIQ